VKNYRVGSVKNRGLARKFRKVSGIVLTTTKYKAYRQCCDPDPGHMFFGLLDPDPDPLVRGMVSDPDPDPSIIK
jgi:hypothetical protein